MLYTITLAYLSSLLLTISNRKINELFIIHHAANFDRKLNYDKLNELSDFISLKNIKKIDYCDFVPFYNVLISLLSLLKYLTCKELYLEELDALFILDEMDNIEKYEYKKNPSFLNLLKVLKRGYRRINNASLLTTYDNDTISGKVFYQMDENDDITILKTEGSFNTMTISEMKNIIKDDNLGSLLGDWQENVVTGDEKIDEIEKRKNYLVNLKESFLQMKDKGFVKKIGERKNNVKKH